MSFSSHPGAGAYTNFFENIPAGSVEVPGLRPGAAGALSIGSEVLSALAGIFTIPPDTVQACAESMRAHSLQTSE